jgi:hypothetical protein
MAERVGFEPTIRLPVCRISSAVLSTTQPPLRLRRDDALVSAGVLIAGKHGAGKRNYVAERGSIVPPFHSVYSWLGSTCERTVANEQIQQSEVKQYTPRVYQSQKLLDVKSSAFSHAHMIDVSGKKQVFENVDFSYSVFTRGYFHQAEFRACNFTGTRFIDCNFRNAIFEDCRFSYCDFSGCRIETDEVLKNLPDRPNVRRELLQIMRKNALSMGDVAAGRAFVIAELAAKKEHLRRAWKQDENYYKKKYGGFQKQSLVLIKRLGLWLDGFLWGHGEKLWNLPISALVVLAVFSVISSATWASSLVDPSISQVAMMFKSYMIYYVSLFLDAPYKDNLQHIVVIDWIVVIFRYVSLGILVSGLFRWLSHR